MPCPKKKSSLMRRGNRRGHVVAKAPTVGNCPNCGSMKLPHHVCGSCGYYDGREIIAAQS